MFRLKSFFFTIFLLTIAVAWFGNTRIAEANACLSNATGNWNTAGTWTSCGSTVPQAADTVEILNTHTVTLDTSPTVTSVTIDSGGTLTEDTNGRTLTVKGAWTNNGTFTAQQSTVVFTAAATITGSTTFNNLTFNGSSIWLDFTIASGTTLTVNGTLYLQQGLRLITGNIDAKGAVTIEANFVGSYYQGSTILTLNGTGAQTVTINGGAFPNVVLNNANLNITPSASVTFNDLTLTAGTYNGGSVTTVIAGNFTNNATFNADTSTVTFTFAKTLTGNTTFNNLTFNGVSTNEDWTIAAGTTLTVNGTLYLQKGRRLFTGNIDAKGAVTIESNFVMGGSTTLTLNGTGSQTVTINGGVFPIVVLNNANLNITPSASVTFTALTLTAGTYNGGSVTTTITYGFTNNATFNADTSTVVFVYAATITGNTTFNNLTFNGASTNEDWTIASGTTLTVNGTLYLQKGRRLFTGNLSIKGNATMDANFAMTGTAVWTFNGTSGQTFTGSSTISPSSSTVTIANTSAAVSLGASSTITTLTVDANATLNLAGYNVTSTTFTNNGTLQLQGDETVSTPTNNSGSTVEYTATSGTRAIKNWAYKSLKINGTGGTFTMHSAGEVLAENLIVSAGTFDLNDYTLSVNGNTTISGGTLMTGTNTITFGDAAGDSVTISSGNLYIESDNTTTDIVKTAGTWTNSGGTITYNAGTVVTTNLLSSLSAYYNLVINSTGSTYQSDGNFTVSNNLNVTLGVLDISTGTDVLTVTGTLTVDGGTLTATAGTLNANGNVTLSSGVLTAPSGTLTILGNWARTSATWTHSNGTVSFASTTATQTVNNGSGSGSAFYVANHTAAGTLQLLTNPLYASSTITNSAGTLDANDLAVVADGLTTVSGGTYQAKTGTQTLAGLTVSGGTFTGSSGIVDVNGNLTLSSGTLTAPSGAFTVSGNWSKTGGTFTPGTGTVTFDGTASGKTIDGGGTAFSNLTVNGSGGAWTVDTSDLTLNQLTLSAGTLTILVSRTLNASSTLTVGGGTLTATNGTVNADGNVTITSGILTAPSGTFIVKGNWALTGGTFIHSSGTVTFATTSTQTLNSGGKVFSIISHTAAGTLQLLTNPLYASSTITNSAGTLDANDLAVVADGLTTVSGGTYQAKTGTQTLAGLTVSGGIFTGSSGIVDVNGNLTLSSGTLTAPSGAFTVSGNWSKTGGTFTPGTGTVTFDGTAQAINDDNTFYNLTDSEASADTLTFEAGATQTVTNITTLSGAAGALLTLVSSAPNSLWSIDPQGTRSISYVDVADSNNVNATAINCVGQNCTDSGHNTNWTFVAPSSSSNSSSSSSAGNSYSAPSPPSNGFRLSINQGVPTTSERMVELGFNAGPDILHLFIARRLDFSDARVYDYQPTITVDLCPNVTPGATCPAGVYPVYVKFVNDLWRASEVVFNTIAYTPAAAPSGFIDNLLNALPHFFQPEAAVPEPPSFPIGELASTTVPLVFRAQRQFLPRESIREFVLAPLSKTIRNLLQKFPTLKKTFEDVGVSKMTDVAKLKTVTLTLPGLTERVGPEGVPPSGTLRGKLALPKGFPTAKLSPSMKQQLPTEIVFAKTGGELIDFNIALSVTEEGEPQQKIETISGKPLQLVVKPDKPVKSVKGYVVFKSKASQPTSLEFPSNSLLASVILANPVFAKTQDQPVRVEEKLVLLEFEYTDPDGDGIYTAEIDAPLIEGEYEIITVMDFEDPNLGKKEIRLTTVIDPEGYLYEKDGDKETRIPGAIISLFWLNPETKQYELWPAKEYQQENPQTTDVRGTYSFLVPEGYYYLKVEASGYPVYDGKPFQVKEGSGIHMNIELKNNYGWLKVIDWKILAIIMFGILLLYHFYRDSMREKPIHPVK